MCVHWVCIHLLMSMCKHLGSIDLACLLINTVQFLGHVRLLVTPWTEAQQASLSITKSWSLLKLSIESVMPPNHLILCHPLLLPPSIFPESGSFLSHLFALGDQSTGVSTSAQVLLMNMQDRFHLG